MYQKLQRPAAPAQHVSELTEASWEDLRVFLICAHNGSFRKAAETMGVTNTTVMRALDRLEMQLGFKLFIRHQAGLLPTEEARDILEDVRQMERLSFDIFRRAAQSAVNPSGIVRVAVTEGVGTYWIMPKLIEFQGTYRLLTIDLRCAMEQADVARLEADIAIQFDKPTRPDLIVTRLGRLHVYPFASDEYARVCGLPKTVAEMRQHRIVQQVAPQLDENAYTKALGIDSVAGIVGIRTNSSTATLYAVERGAGIGMLPTCAIALGAPLIPVDVGIRHHLDLWLTYHPDFKTSEKHAVVVEWLRRVFDNRAYPCFKDEFIHPNELVKLMADAVPSMGLRGYAAPVPFRVAD
ncbi:MAG: LysR family transcriptional regulator [Stellaceae bacterium]